MAAESPSTPQGDVATRISSYVSTKEAVDIYVQQLRANGAVLILESIDTVPGRGS